VTELSEDGRNGAHARNADDRVLLRDQLDFMRQQRLIVFGWMGLTVALAVLLPPLIGSDSLGYLLVSFACTLSGPVAFTIAWRRSARFRARILALDPAPVVLLETGRILGLAILVLYSVEELPAEFAFWGGGLDVFIGATALTVAYALLPMRPFPKRLYRGWNLLGLFDFVVAWPIIFLFSPTVVGVLAGSGPTTEAFLTFPMSFIPMFGVPFTACLHLIALMQTRGDRVPRVNPLFHRTTATPAASGQVSPRSAAREAVAK
jgi:hypothetical protein